MPKDLNRAGMKEEKNNGWRMSVGGKVGVEGLSKTNSVQTQVH